MEKVIRFSMFKALSLLLVCVVFTTVTKGQKVAYDFIEKHEKQAKSFMHHEGIPFSITIGVSMIESAMGTSKNCRLLNNYFGVKGRNTLHRTHPTYRSAYKEYPSAEASFNDFLRIVKSKKYYTRLKGVMEYKKWLLAMNKHGYATAQQKWIHDIERVIKRYHLAEYDDNSLYYEDDTMPIWGLDSNWVEELQD